MRILGYKDNLPLLESSFLPETVALTQENCSDFLGNKGKRILKPSNLFEGKGIILGNEVTQSEWKTHLKEKADQNYIIQEFIDMRKLQVMLYEEDEIKKKELYFDLCPHFFVKAGKVIGKGLVLMRFSEKRILNVAQG